MILPQPHVRITEATMRRQENFRKLIERMKLGGMAFDEICEFLVMSPSGGRKYLRELRDAEVLKIERHDGPGFHGNGAAFEGFPIWGLISHEAAEQFMDATKQVRPHSTPARKKLEQEDDPSVRVYMAHDDTRFVVPRAVVVPRRDDLVAALFGAAGVV